MRKKHAAFLDVGISESGCVEFPCWKHAGFEVTSSRRRTRSSDRGGNELESISCHPFAGKVLSYKELIPISEAAASPMMARALCGRDSEMDLSMNTREKRVRAVVTIGYFVTCFAVLYYYTSGSLFCSRPGESGHTAQTLHLTVACTLWEVLVSICGALVAKQFDVRGVAPVVSAVLALIGFASIPFWIYGTGRFVFEGTTADVSCFFTEGYGSMFPLVVAPALALATLAGELIILKSEPSP